MPDASANGVCLAIEGLTKRFGGFYALNDLTMQVATGHIHALIGPNGAGKTTFFNVVTGLIQPDAGQVIFEGRSLVGLRPNAIVARVHEIGRAHV